ncbi:c-type cytochrome [Pseudooceanicola aestuarii]|uniref:c-type cytochrome n=1 Tax=Pseudooceanicola aestuarii TaxID=2697319 RepID=UPI0013D389C5|nr:cytochrome c family protein [Pseudooceanicola aestuarii]
MFDTMTMTKIIGGFCGALLVFMLGGWAGELLYTSGGGHGDDHAQAYVIDTGVEEDAGAEEETVDFAEVLASADVDKGARVFSKCKACHKLDGTDATGPHLDGVVGRAVAAVDGFGYSGALAANFDTWTPENLSAFLEDPRGTASGTKMTFSGLRKVEDRANLIAYLDSLGG